MVVDVVGKVEEERVVVYSRLASTVVKFSIQVRGVAGSIPGNN